MNNFSEITGFIWNTANLIRDSFKRSKYQDVILPFTVLRRIDCVLEPTKEKVFEAYNKYKDEVEELDRLLQDASGYAFYNTSKYTFHKLLQDPPDLADNLHTYLHHFSPNMHEVLQKFDFENTIRKLEDANLLYKIIERFKNIELHPDKVSNYQMGQIFEELVRRFNEALNENPGEHFTPREVIRLMVNLIFTEDREQLRKEGIIPTVYDPCCGSGGMLTVAKIRIMSMNATADVYLFGQEVNPETYAMCKSDLFLKSPDGRDARNIKFGSTLSNDQLSDRRFDYMLANPPYGKDWRRDQDAVKNEAERPNGRFSAGTPRINDGQLLFLQHMLARMKTVEHGGSRVAIIMNGSPLFTGDAMSGESEIRRWILENDWLEALIELPEQMFYNTGITTYIWVLSNRKSPPRRGKVQMIDASELWMPMRKSLGDKRRMISDAQIEKITELFHRFEENEKVKIFDQEEFGYRKIRVEQPLRQNFQATPERIERLKDERAFQNLAKSRKRNEEAKQKEIELGKQKQQKIFEMLHDMTDRLFKDKATFELSLDEAIEGAELNLKKSVRNNIFNALAEKDQTAEICRDSSGNPESDTALRDYENVPLTEDVLEYFDREIAPHVPEAWIDEDYTDQKDGKVGRVGYELNFNRYFYQYEPPRPLTEIEAEIEQLEKEILEMLSEVTK